MKDDRAILIVEDDLAIRESVAECLAGEGYAVVATAHGAEALERIERDGPPLLVIIDLVMPVMDGAQLVTELRGRRGLRDVPLLLMTAAIGGNPRRLPAVEAVLTKPFDVEELIRTVARLTGRGA